MGKACVYSPNKGADTFYKLKKEFGYEMAWELYGTATHPQFLSDYKNTLSLDAEGIPTFDSLMANKYIQNYIGEQKMAKVLQNELPVREDTLANYETCLTEAFKFNTENPNRHKYVAVVEKREDGKLQAKLVTRSEEAISNFEGQYAAKRLIDSLTPILEPLGITKGMLMEAEVRAGRTGVTDFKMAKVLADDTISMIRVANNMEGYKALSEEYAHLIIGALRNNPLVQRSLNALATDDEALKQVLGDEFDDTMEYQEGDREIIAEEALGKLFQSALQVQVNSPRSRTLIGRLFNYIKSIFRRMNMDDVQRAINDAEGAMSRLAKDILSSKQSLTRTQILASQRDVELNALSDMNDHCIEELKKLRKTEIKREKIGMVAPDVNQRRLDEIQSYIDGAKGKEGLMKYAAHALASLDDANRTFYDLDTASPKDQFSYLRGIQATLQSYKPFIDNFKQLYNASGQDSIDDDAKQVIDRLRLLYDDIADEFLRQSRYRFFEFIKPFMGKYIDDPTLGVGEQAVRDMMSKSEFDITFFDRWLDAMSDSSDVLLQSIDEVVKQAKDRARYAAIEEIKNIQNLMFELEGQGITDFDWMFERFRDGTKTGNYISEVNEEQFWRDYREMLAELDEKYGKNTSGAIATQKLQEKKAWIDAHADFDAFGQMIPDATVYKNEDFYKLTDRQKDARNRILAIKEKLDKLYGDDSVETLKAVQMRKRGAERFIQSLGSPSTIWSNLKEHLADEYLDREDDDQLFGATTAKGITDFAGNPFNVMPMLYTTRLKNPNDISVDLFGSLMAYAVATTQYSELEQVVDSLEVAKTIVYERKPKETRGGKNVVEKFTLRGEEVINQTFKKGVSNAYDRLVDYLDSQVYQKHLKDQGSIEVFGKKVNVNKLVSKLMESSSLFQMGFNYLANLANVMTGGSMQAIEAAAGEFFNAKELAKADAIYAKEFAGALADINRRAPQSKLGLVDQYFNIKGEFNKNIKFNDQRRSLLKRIFGKNVAFLGQEAGDHWLYNRTAIAMMLREKVQIPDGNGGMKETSLWDALQVKKDGRVYELVLPQGTKDSQGNTITMQDLGKFSRKMLKVNQSLFGIYNDDDTCAANRVAVGRMLLQYRKWMKAQYNKRFMGNQYDVTLEQWQEGYYRTFLRAAMELATGRIKLGKAWDAMSNHEKANIKRATTELTLFIGIFALASLLKWPDDKDRPWALKLAEYSTKRLYHELGQLSLSPAMVTESLKTLRNPAAVLSTVNDGVRLLGSILDPRDWMDEAQSGPYKGHSTLFRNTLRGPLPGLRQWKQIDRFLNNLDTSIDSFTRNAF